ncbi:unnamed protein product, partial [Dibothriocephalus latus]
ACPSAYSWSLASAVSSSSSDPAAAADGVDVKSSHPRPVLTVKWTEKNEANSSSPADSEFSIFSTWLCRLSCSSKGLFLKAELLPPNSPEAIGRLPLATTVST